MLKILNRMLITLSLVLLFPLTAIASNTGAGVLPYESWLIRIQESLTGPVAFSVALIGIVTSGTTLIFMGGEIGRFMRSLIYLVLVMTMLIGANSLMTQFFHGAVVSDASVPPREEAMNASLGEISSLNTFLNERVQESC